MPASSPPPELEQGRAITPEDLKSLPAISQRAVQVLESCIAQHHIAAIDYQDPDERRTTIRIRPAFIKTSRAHNVVVWGIPAGADHWIELRLDRIGDVRDTGEVFEPTW